MISTCPSCTGLMSMKASVSASSNSLKHGTVPATILQKMQSGSAAMAVISGKSLFQELFLSARHLVCQICGTDIHRGGLPISTKVVASPQPLFRITGESRYPSSEWIPAFPTEQVRGLKAHGNGWEVVPLGSERWL